MKVKLIVIHPMDLLGNKIGGIQTFIKNFIKYAPDDFEIEVIGVTSDKKNRPIGKWQNIITFGKKVNFLPILYVRDENTRTRIPLSLKFTLALFRYKKLINCDNRILIYHRIEPALAFANASSKKVGFIHNDIEDLLYSAHTEVKWRFFPWLYFQMEKKLIRRMDKVFVVNQKTVEFYQKKYPFMADRFSFLPTWVDQETFFPCQAGLKPEHRSAFLKSRQFPANTKLILFVGRLEGQKDPLLLIDSFNFVNNSAPETILLIVGKGALRNKMEERIAQHGLKEKVIFLNNLPQDKVADTMRISDVFLLTSAFEGMPRSVLEALGSGLPVVSTDVGEVKRVVSNDFSGLVCPERDATVIGNAVLRVLNENKFASDNCVSSIRDYTAERILKRVYDAYRQLGQIQ